LVDWILPYWKLGLPVQIFTGATLCLSAVFAVVRPSVCHVGGLSYPHG